MRWIDVGLTLLRIGVKLLPAGGAASTAVEILGGEVTGIAREAVGVAENREPDFLHQALPAMAREAWSHMPAESIVKFAAGEVALDFLGHLNLHDFLGIGFSRYEIYLEAVHYEINDLFAESPTDFYDFISVPRTATPEDILQAYEDISAKIRKQENPQEAKGELTKFDLVALVADTLHNETTRRHYNKVLERLEGGQWGWGFFIGSCFNLGLNFLTNRTVLFSK